jgi:hypothetical protein
MVWHAGPPESERSIPRGMIAVAGICGEALAAPATATDSIEHILPHVDRAAERIVEREELPAAERLTGRAPSVGDDFHELAQTLIDYRWIACSWPSFLRLVRALAREAIRADWHDFTTIAACLAAEGELRWLTATVSPIRASWSARASRASIVGTPPAASATAAANANTS